MAKLKQIASSCGECCVLTEKEKLTVCSGCKSSFCESCGDPRISMCETCLDEAYIQNYGFPYVVGENDPMGIESAPEWIKEEAVIIEQMMAEGYFFEDEENN